MKPLSLQERATFHARLRIGEDLALQDALFRCRAAASRFASALSAVPETTAAFACEQKPEMPDDTASVRALTLQFNDWADAIERHYKDTQGRRKAGLKALEPQLLGASARLREITAEIERIEAAMPTCDSVPEVKRRVLRSAGAPDAMALAVFPDMDRPAMRSRHTGLLDESRALSEFISTYNPARLPPGFDQWYRGWRLRVGFKAPVEAEAA